MEVRLWWPLWRLSRITSSSGISTTRAQDSAMPWLVTAVYPFAIGIASGEVATEHGVLGRTAWIIRECRKCRLCHYFHKVAVPVKIICALCVTSLWRCWLRQVRNLCVNYYIRDTTRRHQQTLYSGRWESTFLLSRLTDVGWAKWQYLYHWLVYLLLLNCMRPSYHPFDQICACTPTAVRCASLRRAEHIRTE